MIFRILHIYLAFNLLLSSVGILGFEHICQKKGTSVAFIFNSQSCCSKKIQSVCCVTDCTQGKALPECSFKKKPCCEDRTLFNKLKENAITLAKVNLCKVKILIFNVSERPNPHRNSYIELKIKTFKFYLLNSLFLVLSDLRVLYMSFLC